jgi:type IV pilus assembly protein PilC
VPVTKKFAYEALDASGVLQKGQVDAASVDAASINLSSQRLMPLSVTPTGVGLNRDIKIPGFGGRTSLRDLAVMTRQFASMTAAGLTLLRTLAILEEQTSGAKLKAAIEQVRADVERGSTLSSAMTRIPDQFPRLMVSMIKAGEAGGFLDDALERVAKSYEADANLRAKIKSAMTYPVIVLIFSLLLGTGVVMFIVPIFEKMFRQLGGKLPVPTRIMVQLSHSMWWVLPLAIASLVIGLRLYRRAMRDNASFRLRVDQLRLRLPVFGNLFAKIAISRWARNLGTLLAVGVPIIQALEIVGDTSGNAVITEAMADVRDTVRAGNPMSRALVRHAVFPTMVVQMLEVGEVTGQTSEMLAKVADFYDQEVETATDSLTSALEPLLVVLMGLVIGTMVVCLYLPMFSIYQHIQSK